MLIFVGCRSTYIKYVIGIDLYLFFLKKTAQYKLSCSNLTIVNIKVNYRGRGRVLRNP